MMGMKVVAGKNLAVGIGYVAVIEIRIIYLMRV